MRELSLKGSKLIVSTMPNRAEILKQNFLNSIGLPFQKLLPESAIEQALAQEQEKYR